MSVCIHNIITDLEILVQGHLLGKKILNEVMDRRGSAVTTVSHRAHSKMKELSVKLYEKRGDCLASGFVSELSGAVYPKILESKLKELKGLWDRWMEERQDACIAKYGT